MPSICLYFVFFRRKFSEKSENSLEIPKILRKFRKFSENSENSQKFLKIRRKFWKFAENSLKRRSFYEALILYRIVSYREKNPHIVSISYRVEISLSLFIAQDVIWTYWGAFWKNDNLERSILLRFRAMLSAEESRSTGSVRMRIAKQLAEVFTCFS